MFKIKTDSRKVNSGDTFIAIKGMTVDGHEYINHAIANGATKIIAQKGNYSVETIIVEDTKKYLEEYLQSTYQDILDKMNFIALTGTNGKTTTAYLVFQLLQKIGCKCAYIGTIGFYIDGKLVKELENTSPEITEIYSLIIEANENNCTHVILEASSHALDQNRLAGINFDAAAFTNLTQDHLDYHKDMEEYLNAKLKILSHMKQNGIFITNIDDSYGEKFAGPNTKTLGFNAKDYKILNFEPSIHTTTIEFEYEQTKYTVNTNLTSKFNVYNYLEALALVHSLDIPIEEIIKITKDIYPPKGRCEIIPIGNAKAVVDYAHTPDAVEKIIMAFRENKNGKIITVVGCGGDRDPLKRPKMGEVATRLSDYVIFTNDNPRTEDDAIIMQNILDGVEKDNYEVLYDRGTAIKEGINLLKDNDTLLILGKGHEDYQIIGTEKNHFDDTEEVKRYIDEKSDEKNNEK